MWHDITVKIAKCTWGTDKANLIGHEVQCGQGVSASKAKVEDLLVGILIIDQIDTCASETMAAAGPWDFADNGRREKPTTPSWYSCIIGPGSIFQIVNPSPCRPTRRAEIPSREGETMTLCQIQSNDTRRIQPDRCIMVDSELRDVFSSPQRCVKSMEPSG